MEPQFSSLYVDLTRRSILDIGTSIAAVFVVCTNPAPSIGGVILDTRGDGHWFNLLSGDVSIFAGEPLAQLRTCKLNWSSIQDVRADSHCNHSCMYLPLDLSLERRFKTFSRRPTLYGHSGT